jgi:uncharacterized protein YjbI with pentapeptide repeats
MRASKVGDLEAARGAVVDAAGVSAGLWFSYIFVMLYLLIAAGGVTHRDLLLETPVKLPFLNVDLPLVGFFVLGPALFLILHAYVLVHFVLLANKVGAFNEELGALDDEEVTTRLRRRLPINIFAQSLAGPRDMRTGIIGFLLRSIAQISLVAGPIALLAFFQLQFLAYHNEAITWWQRIAIVTDLVILWILWPSVVLGGIGLTLRDAGRWKLVGTALASLATVLLAFTIATFPGEWLHNNLPSIRLVPWKDHKESRVSETDWRRASLHELLVGGEPDLGARRPKSVWSNRLVLPGFDVIDRNKLDSEEKIAAFPEIISLRMRNLEGAVLIGGTFRKVDFTGAKLQGAKLGTADLRDAKLLCIGMTCTQLQGADLIGARLQGADLSGAQFQGADLNGVQFQGADLSAAQFQGADLTAAQLQGADLRRAQLEGAYLNDAQLQGSDLSGAKLQGADLSRAKLQGADLSRAELQSADLQAAAVWRAIFRDAIGGSTFVADSDMSPVSFEDVKRQIESIPKSIRRDAALQRIQVLDPTRFLAKQGEINEAWTALKKSSPARDKYNKDLIKQLKEIGCNNEGAALYFVRMQLRWDFNRILDEEEKKRLATDFLDEEHCAGARKLFEAEKVLLRAIRDRAPP